MKKINSKILGIIVLSTIFGLGSGMVGTLLTRVYVLEDSFKVPLYGEINLSGSQYNGSNLVINNAKKVVVEQDTKVADTIKSAEASIVGIFDKKEIAKNQDANNELNISKYYQSSDRIAQGLIITSDGWILSNFIPQELKSSQTKDVVSVKVKEKVISLFVIITNDNKIYPIDDIIIDNSATHSFLHVKETGFPVKSFVTKNDVTNGKMIVGVNWDKNITLSTILNVKRLNNALVQSSDDFMEQIILSEDVSKKFDQGFYFDLNGNLVALTDLDGTITPIYSYLSCINCLLNKKAITRPSLGVNYIDLSKLITGDVNKKLAGALIAKDSHGISVMKDGVADKAGFLAGDIITAINGTPIDEVNDLAQMVSSYPVGTDIIIDFERNGGKFSVTVKLGKQ